MDRLRVPAVNVRFETLLNGRLAQINGFGLWRPKDAMDCPSPVCFTSRPPWDWFKHLRTMESCARTHFPWPCDHPRARRHLGRANNIREHDGPVSGGPDRRANGRRAAPGPGFGREMPQPAESANLRDDPRRRRGHAPRDARTGAVFLCQGRINEAEGGAPLFIKPVSEEFYPHTDPGFSRVPCGAPRQCLRRVVPLRSCRSIKIAICPLSCPPSSRLDPPLNLLVITVSSNRGRKGRRPVPYTRASAFCG